MFEVLLALTLLVCAASIAAVYARTRDPFHPLMILGPMLVILYWYMPSSHLRHDQLREFFADDDLAFVQLVSVAGVIAIIAGTLAAGLPRIRRGYVGPWTAALVSLRSRKVAYWLGGIGCTAWLITLWNVGGLQAAFGQAYSGGWSDNGYIRDSMFLTIPAFLLLMASVVRRKGGPLPIVAAIAFTMPFLIQGALGAKRGPTFMILASAGSAWYLFRGRRPSLFKAAALGAGLAFTVLFLLLNRNNIYLGSDQSLQWNVLDILDQGSSGSEYIYGGGSILNARETQSYFWGKRILAQFVVRPVPRQWWPNKYADFGLPELEQNAGTGGDSFKDSLGWAGAIGSAPGIVADVWIEFWWFGLLLLFGIGYAYGRCWRNAVTLGGPWILQYLVLLALSVYLVMQTMEAVIFRALILSTPIWVLWSNRDVKRLGRGRSNESVSRVGALRPVSYGAPAGAAATDRCNPA